MSTPPAELLSRLGSGIRPIDATTPEESASNAGPSFDTMLKLARRGELTTGLPVEVADDVAVSLTGDQRGRLSAAVDRLAATDARRALVLLDDVALLTDPNARRVSARADLGSGTPVVGIDSFTAAPSSGATPVPTAPAADPDSLLRALARPLADLVGDVPND